MTGAQDAATLLAGHAHDYTDWGADSEVPKSVCLCKVKTPVTLPTEYAHLPEQEVHKAVRAAHATHLAELLTADGYRRPAAGGREIIVPAPNVLHKGPNDSDADFMRIAAKHLEGGYPVGGSNLTYAVIKLLRDTANSLDAAPAS